MIENSTALLAALRERGLINNEATPAIAPIDATQDRPWYIGLLLGLSGWIAGIFLLMFVGALYFSVTGNATIAGIVLLAAAWGLFRVDVEGAFVSQLALSLSVAGQCAIVYGLSNGFQSSSIQAPAAIALILQIVLVAIMPSRMHRTMSALFACAAWALLVRSLFGDDPFYSGRTRSAPPSLALALTSWALAWAPVCIALYVAVSREHAWMASRWRAMIRPALAGLIAGLAWATLLTHPLDALAWGQMNDTRSGWLALWPLLSACAALAALAAAFALKHSALMGATIIAALWHVSHFYYAMGTTLLVKSILMLTIGAALLVVARAWTPPGQKS
jgi:Domain of unknown function (DUF4401)